MRGWPKAPRGRRGDVQVNHVVAAIGPGHAASSPAVQMSIQDAIVHALTAAPYGGITVQNGRIEQSNFDGYEMLRMVATPQNRASDRAARRLLGGVGKAGTRPLAPARGKAIFAATAEGIRELPLKNQDLN